MGGSEWLRILDLLEISRSDVVGTERMEYPSEDRFIKLPVKPYLELLGIDPIGSQISVINAINNPKYRFICGALSRRQGKTYIANIIGQLTVLVPGSHVLLMSPNYSLSQISFDLQRNLIKHLAINLKRLQFLSLGIHQIMKGKRILSCSRIQSHRLDSLWVILKQRDVVLH